MCVLRLKPRAAIVRTASSGVRGHLPSERRNAREGSLQEDQ